MFLKALLAGVIIFCILSAGIFTILYIFGQLDGYIALIVAGFICVFFETEINKFFIWVGKNVEKY